MAPIVAIPQKIPLLVIAGDVLLPGGSMRIPITFSENLQMVKNEILNRGTLSSAVIGIFSKDIKEDLKKDIHPIGTAAVVVQTGTMHRPHPVLSLLVTGLCRIKVENLVSEDPYPVGIVTQLDKLSTSDDDEDGENVDPEHSALINQFRELANKYVDMLNEGSPEVGKLKAMLTSLPDHHLIDVLVSLVRASASDKLEILNALDMTERLKKALLILRHVSEKDNFLPSRPLAIRYRTIQRPLPLTRRDQRSSDLSNFPEDDDIVELEKKLKEAGLPPQVHKVAMKELARLKKMSSFGPEHGVVRNYLELVSELPWSKSSEETIDIIKARNDLDADHYAMEKVKRRVLEYLAVRQLKNSLRGPILCFVGPPGVGKTSVGRSIAHTMGREFHRISLGGVCNQSDIRGHRRTYIGAMPGRIIQGLKTAGVRNPVFLLDEVDKLTSGIHGDPSAALLEVLDPEQNCAFVDHYLNVPFDLSQVMFIATANSTKTIPAALLDRMEVITVPGYTQEEKLHIATRHLLPKQLEIHGLNQELLTIPESCIALIISEYTREAGVRTLERKLGALCRAVAVRVAEARGPAQAVSPVTFPMLLDKTRVEEILGPAVYLKNDLWSRLGLPGVAVGLAWTKAGGEVMLVEACKMEGDGELVLTGHLGDVMKESARLALNWVRTQSLKYGLKLDGETLSHTDMHIHFPAGAVGKDGPSAGVTIATALMSLFSDRPVATDVAMTGEITLQGVVLPVGGVKDKVLAAHRAGLKRVILPQMCEKDLTEVPKSVKNDLTFIFVTRMTEVLHAAFDGGFPGLSGQDIQLVNKL